MGEMEDKDLERERERERFIQGKPWIQREREWERMRENEGE